MGAQRLLVAPRRVLCSSRANYVGWVNRLERRMVKAPSRGDVR